MRSLSPESRIYIFSRKALHVPALSCFPEPGVQPINLFRRLRQVDRNVLGSDDDAGTPSRSDGRLVQRRLATRPATPSTPQVCRRDARRRPARVGTGAHDAVRSRQTSRRRSASGPCERCRRRRTSEGGRRINDGNCPPVAHRLSRLGRNEFSDAASISAEELPPGRRDAGRHYVGDSAPWRQSSGVATPEQESTIRGNGAPLTDHSLTVITCEPRIRGIALLSRVNPSTMNFTDELSAPKCAIKIYLFYAPIKISIPRT